jgi:hypothetical protein
MENISHIFSKTCQHAPKFINLHFICDVKIYTGDDESHIITIMLKQAAHMGLSQQKKNVYIGVQKGGEGI